MKYDVIMTEMKSTEIKQKDRIRIKSVTDRPKDRPTDRSTDHSGSLKKKFLKNYRFSTVFVRSSASEKSLKSSYERQFDVGHKFTTGAKSTLQTGSLPEN